MIVRETGLPGVLLMEPVPHADERGSFTRIYCERTFAALGLEPCGAQWSLSGNPRRGTLRGLHLQAPPFEETKLVRCVRGAVFDVAVDLRPGSPARGRHAAVELSARNRLALYVPKGVAHGFLTLEDDTEVLYAISPAYAGAGAARGVRWDDPALAVPWPFPPGVISERDAALPAWDP